MLETDRRTDTQTDYSMPLLRLRAPRHNNNRVYMTLFVLVSKIHGLRHEVGAIVE